MSCLFFAFTLEKAFNDSRIHLNFNVKRKNVQITQLHSIFPWNTKYEKDDTKM